MSLGAGLKATGKVALKGAEVYVKGSGRKICGIKPKSGENTFIYALRVFSSLAVGISVLTVLVLFSSSIAAWWGIFITLALGAVLIFKILQIDIFGFLVIILPLDIFKKGDQTGNYWRGIAGTFLIGAAVLVLLAATLGHIGEIQ